MNTIRQEFCDETNTPMGLDNEFDYIRWLEAKIQALRKTAVISSCDCLVGFLSGERVSKSTIDYEVKRISDIQPKFKEYGLLNGGPLSPKQIVDNRRGYLSRFAYCPYCGEKINWKQVLSNCL